MIAVPLNAEQVHPSAQILLESVRRLGVPFGCEQSCRLARESMLADRFLLSVSKASLGNDASARIERVCGDLNMPPAFLNVARQYIPQIAFFHFGFEQNGASSVYKFYLELAVPRHPPDATEPIVVHRAIKWDCLGNSRSVTSQYVWHPSISVPQVQARLSSFYSDAHKTFAMPTNEILASAARRPIRGGVRFLEVVDDDSPRRSFDVNLYDAGLRVCDVHAELDSARRQFAINPRKLQELYNQIAPMRLGHLAGGLHRNGEPFMTIYYGATSSVQGR